MTTAWSGVLGPLDRRTPGDGMGRKLARDGVFTVRPRCPVRLDFGGPVVGEVLEVHTDSDNLLASGILYEDHDPRELVGLYPEADFAHAAYETPMCGCTFVFTAGEIGQVVLGDNPAWDDMPPLIFEES